MHQSFNKEINELDQNYHKTRSALTAAIKPKDAIELVHQEDDLGYSIANLKM